MPYVVDGEVTSEHHNQSLPGAGLPPGHAQPVVLDLTTTTGTRRRYHNSSTSTRAGAAGSSRGAWRLFAAGWSSGRAARRPQPRQGWRLAAEFSLVVLGMLLFSERTWKHHCVTLVLPFAVIAYYLAACRPGAACAAYLVGTLVVSMVLMATTSTSLLQLLDNAAKLFQVYGAYLWSNLILVVALFVLLRQPERSAESAQPLLPAAESPAVRSVPPDPHSLVPTLRVGMPVFDAPRRAAERTPGDRRSHGGSTRSDARSRGIPTRSVGTRYRGRGTEDRPDVEASSLLPIAWVQKRDGRLAPFEPDRICQALFEAGERLGFPGRLPCPRADGRRPALPRRRGRINTTHHRSDRRPGRQGRPRAGAAGPGPGLPGGARAGAARA